MRGRGRGSGGDAPRDPGAPSVSLPRPGNGAYRDDVKNHARAPHQPAIPPVVHVDEHTLADRDYSQGARVLRQRLVKLCIYAPPLRSALRCMSNPSCGRSGPAHESESGSLIRELASQAPGILDVARFSLRSQKRFPKPAYL